MTQFSTRDLLLLTVIVALALGWLFDRRPSSGRFQITATENHAFVVDTATGQVWSQPVIGDSMAGDINTIQSPKIGL
jgi:hypothetical protein